MALGSYGGPEGSVAGCFASVTIAALRDAHNPEVARVGKTLGYANEAYDVLSMRSILLSPAKTERLLNDWASLLRQLAHR